MAIDDKITNAYNEGKTVASAADAIYKDAKVVAKIVSPRSISRLAKDSVFEFPMFISGAIDTDEVFVLAKSAERNYAQLMASVISLYGYVDLRKGSIADYLKKFHTNGSFGAKFGDDFASESASIDPEKINVTLESATIDNTSTVINVDMNSLWDSVTESLDTENFNDMYKPYRHTKALLESALTLAKGTIATEKVTSVKDAPGVYDIGNPASGAGVRVGQLAKDQDNKYETTISYKDDKGKEVTRDVIRRNKDSRDFNMVIDDKVTNGMTPTMVKLQFVVDAAGNGRTWMQNVTVGIKAMVRMIRSSSMVGNITEACENRAIFKAISYTSGEKKAAELISNAFVDGRDSVTKKNERWMNAIKARQGLKVVNLILGRRLMPNATIIMTAQEAEAVKAACGVDIRNASNARKIISKYFILGLGIYDTEAKVLEIIYDGDSDYQDVSLRTLIAQNKKDTEILTAMNKY